MCASLFDRELPHQPSPPLQHWTGSGCLGELGTWEPVLLRCKQKLTVIHPKQAHVTETHGVRVPQGWAWFMPFNSLPPHGSPPHEGPQVRLPPHHSFSSGFKTFKGSWLGGLCWVISNKRAWNINEPHIQIVCFTLMFCSGQIFC